MIKNIEHKIKYILMSLIICSLINAKDILVLQIGRRRVNVAAVLSWCCHCCCTAASVRPSDVSPPCRLAPPCTCQICSAWGTNDALNMLQVPCLKAISLSLCFQSHRQAIATVFVFVRVIAIAAGRHAKIKRRKERVCPRKASRKIQVESRFNNSLLVPRKR